MYNKDIFKHCSLSKLKLEAPKLDCVGILFKCDTDVDGAKSFSV